MEVDERAGKSGTKYSGKIIGASEPYENKHKNQQRHAQKEIILSAFAGWAACEIWQGCSRSKRLAASLSRKFNNRSAGETGVREVPINAVTGKVARWYERTDVQGGLWRHRGPTSVIQIHTHIRMREK